MYEILDRLSTEQLEKLNNVIARVIADRQGTTFIDPLTTTSKPPIGFWHGRSVRFKDREGNILEGKVYKINAKTVGVIDAVKRRWRVSPSLLTLV